jgi:hypothetical protein
MQKRARRTAVAILLTGIWGMASVSAAGAHPLVVEATATGVTLTNGSLVVTFQCSATDWAAPLGSHLTLCAVQSLETGVPTYAQVKASNGLWIGQTTVSAAGGYRLCAGGYVIHPLGARSDVPNDCAVAVSRQAVFLRTSPIL